jgi:hypothetical protein
MLTDTRRPPVADLHPSPFRPRPVARVALRRAPPAYPPRWFREVALVAALYVVYDTTRGLRRGSIAGANRSGSRLLSWEQSLHLDPEHTLNQLLWHTPALAVPASFFYATLHFIITPAVLIWLYRRHPANYRTARTAILIGTALALIIFWLDPTTPPRLLPGGDFHDILGQSSRWGWWGSEGSAPRGLGNLTNQLAAMPSLHVGWALWSGWLIARHARHTSIRILGAAYPILTTLVVLGTGNHYLLDTLAGAGVIATGAAAATLAAQKRGKHHLRPADTAPTLIATGPQRWHDPLHQFEDRIGADMNSQAPTDLLPAVCEGCADRYDPIWRYCPTCGTGPLQDTDGTVSTVELVRVGPGRPQDGLTLTVLDFVPEADLTGRACRF